MQDARILLVDKSVKVRKLIEMHLSAEGFITDVAYDGISILKLIRRNDYNIIIMDTALEDLDAWHVCRQIRKNTPTPIIILSWQISEEEKLSFFEAGIEDYMQKPISYKELIARIHVILRRCAYSSDFSPRHIIFDGLCIDVVSRTVYVDGKMVILTPREYSLLLYLANNPQKAVSRETILNNVWGEDFFGTDRTVDTHIKTLREHIKPYNEFIGTVWGFGYIFKP